MHAKTVKNNVHLQRYRALYWAIYRPISGYLSVESSISCELICVDPYASDLFYKFRLDVDMNVAVVTCARLLLEGVVARAGQQPL